MCISDVEMLLSCLQSVFHCYIGEFFFFIMSLALVNPPGASRKVVHLRKTCGVHEVVSDKLETRSKATETEENCGRLKRRRIIGRVEQGTKSGKAAGTQQKALIQRNFSMWFNRRDSFQVINWIRFLRVCRVSTFWNEPLTSKMNSFSTASWETGPFFPPHSAPAQCKHTERVNVSQCNANRRKCMWNQKFASKFSWQLRSSLPSLSPQLPVERLHWSITW